MTRAQEKAETLAFLADPNRVTFYEPLLKGYERPLTQEQAEAEEAWLVAERERRGQEIARLMRGTLPPTSTLPRLSVPCRVCGKVMPSYDWSRHAGWTGKECAGRPVEARKPARRGRSAAKAVAQPQGNPWANLRAFDAEMAARAA